jgi:hypothetical protein
MKPVAVTARPPALFHSPAPTTMFKRQTVILPFNLPHLSDKAAAQLIELLHQIVDGIEHHYAEQAHRCRKRQQQIASTRRAPASNPTDPPF